MKWTKKEDDMILNYWGLGLKSLAEMLVRSEGDILIRRVQLLKKQKHIPGARFK
jgi:hypothetical protein